MKRFFTSLQPDEVKRLRLYGIAGVVVLLLGGVAAYKLAHPALSGPPQNPREVYQQILWQQWQSYATKAAHRGDYDQAIEGWSRLLKMELGATNRAAALFERAKFYGRKENWTNAIADLNEAIRLNPQERTYVFHRAWAHRHSGDWAKAIEDFRESAKLAPNDVGVQNDLAWILATCPNDALRNGQAAVAAARKACELTQWKMWQCLGTLAAAYAEAGDFAQAVKYQQQALAEPKLSANERADETARLQLYQAGKPFRETIAGK